MLTELVWLSVGLSSFVGFMVGAAWHATRDRAEAGTLTILLNGEPLYILPRWYDGGTVTRQLVEFGKLDYHVSVWLTFDNGG